MMKLIRKYKESCIGVGIAIFAVLVYMDSLTIKDMGLTGTVNAASVPQWICVVLWGLSAALIIQDISAQRKRQDNSSEERKGPAINYLAFFLTAAAISAYIVVMKPLGFCPSSALFLFVEFCILSEREERNYPLFAGIAAVVSVVIYLAFRMGLNLMLPRGIMPF